MKAFFRNTDNASDILALRRESSDIFVINYHKTLCFNLISGIPSAVRAAREVSLYTRSPVLLHGRLDIEGDAFLSTMVMKKGEIIGVGDCITNEGFTAGNALRMYELCGKKIGLAVDCDVFESGTDNFFYAGCGAVFHNTLSRFDKSYFASYKSHMRLSKGKYVGLFGDCVVEADKRLRIFPADGEAEIVVGEIGPLKSFLKISQEF